MELRQATSAELIARNCATFSAWGAKLSLEQYLTRERILRDQPFSRERMRTWVLADGHNVLASCESYRIDAYVRGDDGTQTGHAEAAASIFVEGDRRGQGLATGLVDRLATRIKAEGAMCLVLFSEVGRAIYERLSFVARPASSRVFPSVKASSEFRVADMLTIKDVDLVSTLANYEASTFGLRYTDKQILWHLARSRYYAEILDLPITEDVGARADDAWAFWAPDYKNDRLYVLATRPGLPNGTRAVLEAARRAAGQCKLSSVHMWENPLNIDRIQGGESISHETEIPMLRSLDTRVTANAWVDYERVLWV